MTLPPRPAWLGRILVFLFCLATASAAELTPASDLFGMDGRSMVTAPEHLGILNGRLTVGTPGTHAGRVDGLWAPPWVSSDFQLRAEIFGRELPAPVTTWRARRLDQAGATNGIEVSSAVVLSADRRGGWVSLTLRNTTGQRQVVPLGFRVRGSLDRREVWEFAQPRSSTPTTARVERGALILSAGDGAVVFRGSGEGWKWDASSAAGTIEVTAEPGQAITVHLALAIGPADEAMAAVERLASDPAGGVAAAEAAANRQIEGLFERLPRLTSDNRELERFYARSLLHFVLNRWEVPEFVLHPFYSTGSVRGGCVTEYLWNYGESMFMMPLHDPAAHREHIRQFLGCDMTRHFAFNPMDGKAHGPWYMVNQEKIVGLVYQHVRMTGDVAFLHERVGELTVLEHVLKNATFGDDPSKPVELIDYGPSNSHLELRRQYGYNHVMPDLNGRRYANLQLAARLAEVAGAPDPGLRRRADALRTLLKQRLWNPRTRWFDFLDAQGKPETRWTVQMFYLLGSGVLDRECEAGLLGHLNEREFLGPFGLHSLAKDDPAYDPADVDNAGPGACTSFAPNIALLLYQAGHPREASDLLGRCLWWGSRLPYWGDSIYADRVDYRRDTPLQCTLDSVAAAGALIFGLFGIDPQFDGRILVQPRPAPWAPRSALRGVRLRDVVFDVEMEEQRFKVTANGRTVAARLGQTMVVQREGAGTGLRVVE